MKNTNILKPGALLAAGLLCASPMFAADTQNVNAVEKALRSVPVAELSAKAASLVAAASVKGQEATARQVIRAAAKISPQTIPSVVGQVVKTVPGVVGPVVVEAIGQQPGQAADIVAAASSHSPTLTAAVVSDLQRTNTMAQVALVTRESGVSANPPVVSGPTPKTYGAPTSPYALPPKH